LSSIAEGIALLYAHYALESDTGFADFHVSICRPPSLRGLLLGRVVFSIDGRTFFHPVSPLHAFAMLEWGLNRCVSTQANEYLILHAAIAEKGGLAVVMPGEPGCGKSTLCAALLHRGWRLLSDELTLICPGNVTAMPVPRPISLKNASIDVIRKFAPEAIIGQLAHDTAKGTVAHMCPSADSVARSQESARPVWIIFPRYAPDELMSLEPVSKGRAFMRLVKNSFNYSVLGMSAFKTVAEVIDTCDCYDLSYHDLGQAISVFDALEPPTASGFTRAMTR
jgi:HprK-related kinase A